MRKQSMCCWRREWLFIFYGSSASEGCNQVRRLGIREARRQRWEQLALLFYILESYTTLRSVFVAETGRIALYSSDDINTLVDVSKEGIVFPVAASYFGRWEQPDELLNPFTETEDAANSEGGCEWICQKQQYLERFT